MSKAQRKTRRRSRNASVREVQTLVSKLPAHLKNVAGCTAFDSVEEFQREVADYLRSIPANEHFAPQVAQATGVGLCIVVNDRLRASARETKGELKHAS